MGSIVMVRLWTESVNDKLVKTLRLCHSMALETNEHDGSNSGLHI